MNFVRVDTGTDVVVVGGGLIGLATALELHRRGAAVTVVEQGICLGGASMAAAGMLAVEDPFNAPEVRALSEYSVGWYPEFLATIEEISGIVVPFHTQTTWQYLAGGARVRLAERSLDPRALGSALLAAVRRTSINVMEETRTVGVDGMRVQVAGGAEIAAKAIVIAAGAWTGEVLVGERIPVVPRKGQMLRVKVPEGMVLDEVHRSEAVYVVPRTRGANAGTALIGATVENVGFDVSVREEDLRRLRGLAAELVPEMAEAVQVEAWAGLRPATPDLLPVIGACGAAGVYVAGGHYRNGALWAPGTAVLVADLVEGYKPEIDVAGLSPVRFVGISDSERVADEAAQVGR